MRILSLLTLLTFTSAASAGELFVYAGASTRGDSSKGITLLKMDTATGALTIVGGVAEMANPPFLALNPEGTRLYTTSESGKSAAAFKINKSSGALTKLNELPVGDKPDEGACHLCVVPGARMLVTANYTSGSTTVFSLAEDGSLAARTGYIQHTGRSVDPGRQEAPHAHGAYPSPDGRHVLVNDLGTDRVYVYAMDAAARTLKPKAVSEGVVKPGAGPRHSAFCGSVLYCLNELDFTITSFLWNAAKGSLTPGATVSTVPDDAPRAGLSSAEIFAHPNGKFLYASNRGHNSIACFAITDAAKGTLQRLAVTPAAVRIPRSFNITPDGKWLLTCGQDSSDIAVFSIATDGTLKPTPHRVEVGNPGCIVFLVKE